MLLQFPRATSKQIKYIEQLSIDLGLDRHRTVAHAKSIIGRGINFLDELTKIEASLVIDKFKEWKDK